jgi:hypothetical protein
MALKAAGLTETEPPGDKRSRHPMSSARIEVAAAAMIREPGDLPNEGWRCPRNCKRRAAVERRSLAPMKRREGEVNRDYVLGRGLPRADFARSGAAPQWSLRELQIQLAPPLSGTSMRIMPSCREVMNNSPSRLMPICRSARGIGVPIALSIRSRNDTSTRLPLASRI